MLEVSVCFISDTHNVHFDPAPADVLIHCGDLTNHGTPTEIANGLLWLASQPHTHVAYLPGNHDILMEHGDFAEAMGILVPRVQLLHPGINAVGPITVASLPWVMLQGWAFDAPDHVVAHGVDTLIGAKAKPEVLVTHSPPFGTLDTVEARMRGNGQMRPGGNVGIKRYTGLAERIGAQVHAFGHIHECGQMRERVGSVTHVNAAVLMRDYETVIQPGMVERIRVGA